MSPSQDQAPDFYEISIYIPLGTMPEQRVFFDVSMGGQPGKCCRSNLSCRTCTYEKLQRTSTKP